jgi:hypothetical protein
MSRIAVRALDELLLVARQAHVIDDEPTAGHQVWDNDLVDHGVQLRRLVVGEAKHQLVGPGQGMGFLRPDYSLERGCASSPSPSLESKLD